MDATKPVVAEVELRGGKIAYSRWNALSRIDVVEKNNANPMIFIDAAAATEIAPPKSRQQSRNDISSLAYQLRDQPSVVIIGSGGGIDVQNAIAFDARSVIAVEINSIINDLVTKRYKHYVGDVFADPRVRLVRDEGRSYINRSKESFDVIQITLIDTWAASVSGAYSLSENYLYTTEAFRSYLERLTPGGYVSITRWYYESIRLVALGRAALRSLGVEDASRYMLVLQDGVRHLFLMKREPFTGTEMERIRDYARATGKIVVHDPVSPSGVSFHDRFLAAPDTGPLLAKTRVALDPVSDDSPFFFQMIRWRHLGLFWLKEFKGASVLDPLAAPVGQMALITALALGILLSVVLMAIPVLKKAVPRRGRVKWLGYFFALGISYITVEVVLMQRLALFLGHPTYSVTTVLFAILLFSGLGSGWSDRRRGSTASVARPVLWLLPIAVVLLVFAVPPLMRALIGLPHAARLGIAIAVVAPVAFLMGVPFPLGIRAVGASNRKHIPWAWAANGCASVIGSVCAVLGAMAWNFSVMLLIAGVIYLAALLGITRMRIDVP
jgi:spermidine synthase